MTEIDCPEKKSVTNWLLVLVWSVGLRLWFNPFAAREFVLLKQSLQRRVSRRDWATPKRSFCSALVLMSVHTRSQKSSRSSYDVLPADTKHVTKDVIGAAKG